ncbi:hypothetical protein D3C78_1271250 [compost metagenome]
MLEGAGEAGANGQELEGAWWSDLDIAAHVAHYEEQYDRKEAIKRAAVDRGLPKREVYNEVNR